jgi:hypothetical protein
MKLKNFRRKIINVKRNIINNLRLTFKTVKIIPTTTNKKYGIPIPLYIAIKYKKNAQYFVNSPRSFFPIISSAFMIEKMINRSMRTEGTELAIIF